METSGIGSAPHRLTKRLAKPLSAALGTINDSHLRNSSDLIHRLRLVNFEEKMASFEVKPLFTNFSVEGAMNAVRKAVESFSDSDLCVRKADYVELVDL